jgi:Coenzyme PQQ synthesis protein D (PqqD)
MAIRSDDWKPRARKAGLVVRVLDDEVVVYDMERNQAHCLNETAAAVWNRCDGDTTISQLAYGLKEEVNTAVDDEVVWYALTQLGRDHLLEEGPAVSDEKRGISRRQMIERVGVTLAIPVVASIVAPTIASASSPTTSCIGSQPCTTSAQCMPLVSGGVVTPCCCSANNTNPSHLNFVCHPMNDSSGNRTPCKSP